MSTLDHAALAHIEGGDIVDVIDGACASIGLGAVFWAKALAIPAAFCAGWVIVRLFS